MLICECLVGIDPAVLAVLVVHVQAIMTVQDRLLRLHNLFSHPVLGTCLTSTVQGWYATVVQCWAPAVLKVRGSNNSVLCRNQEEQPALPAAASDASVQDQEDAQRGRGTYSLLQHAGMLTSAAQATMNNIAQVCSECRQAEVICGCCQNFQIIYTSNQSRNLRT
jgi:hypothetical protein